MSIRAFAFLMAIALLAAACEPVHEPPAEDIQDSALAVLEPSDNTSGELMPPASLELAGNLSVNLTNTTDAVGSGKPHIKVVNVAGDRVSRYKNFILLNVDNAFFNSGDSLLVNYNFTEGMYELQFDSLSKEPGAFLLSLDGITFEFPMNGTGRREQVNLSLGRLKGNHLLKLEFRKDNGAWSDEVRAEYATSFIQNMRLVKELSPE